MPADWLDDADGHKLLSKYLLDDRNYPKWALQVMDSEHEFHVTTGEDKVLGSKMCTPEGPEYYLFDREDVDLVDVAPRLVLDNLDDLAAWHKRRSEAPAGRSVNLQEFRLFMLEYSKNKGDVHCCGAPKVKSRRRWVSGI
jgi:hypothetical protein